jgi:hypothetical protein
VTGPSLQEAAEEQSYPRRQLEGGNIRGDVVSDDD